MMKFSSVLFLSLVLYFRNSHANLQFCLGGQQHQLTGKDKDSVLFPVELASLERDFSDSAEELGCKNGILFNKPIKLEGVASSNKEPFCYKKSICDPTWQCTNQKKRITAELIKVGKPGLNETWILTQNDDDLLPSSNCKQPWAKSRQKRASSPQINGLVPSEPTSTDLIQREVDDQTKRMFYYLAGINQDQVNSHLRVVKLFKMSSQLVSMICDPHYISPKFLKEIQRGFLFLLSEQGFDKMVDLDLESYNQLKQTLEHCAATVKQVKFMGSPCPTGIKVDRVYVFDGNRPKSLFYERGPKTFKWGEYDVVLDGAWSTMSVVHAGCFQSFKGKVNLLHQFEVALEQLFHSALYLRWEHPTQLADDLFYDSMFMARVNDTMEAMDACTKFLYLLTPFANSALNRPIHETVYRRKKRHVEFSDEENENDKLGKTFSSMENSVEENSRELFQCFQSDEEMKSLVEEQKESQHENCK